MLILGGIVIALVALVGFFIYLAAIVVMWILIAVFCVFTLAIGWAVGDPYVGALCAVPATGITLWLFAHYSEANESKK